MTASKLLDSLILGAGIVLIGVGDFITGYEVSFGTFYLIPILAAAWLCDQRIAVITAVGSGFVWLVVELMSGHPYTQPLTPYWNASVRLAMFLSVALAVSKLRLVQAQQAELIRQLQDAMSRVRVLSGLLPICAWCKKIRDDKGYWEQVDTYLQRHTDTQFTHGMCPDCAAVERAKLKDL